MTRFIIVTQNHGIVDSCQSDNALDAACHMNLKLGERMYVEVDHGNLEDIMSGFVNDDSEGMSKPPFQGDGA